MSWAEHRTLSQQYASQAEDLCIHGDYARASELYLLAAKAEEKAFRCLDDNQIRTIGITAISAVSLYSKSCEPEQVERVTREFLDTLLLPPFAVDQIQDR